MIQSASLENSIHCRDLAGDRKAGEYWEREFCKMAAKIGKSFTPMQIGRTGSTAAYKKNVENWSWSTYTLPDVTVWTSPSEHHEIKHKNPTKYECFGLEVYRFKALLWFAEESGQTVMYTIHNHDLAGGRDERKNDIKHWITANVFNLNGNWQTIARGKSWVNGIPRDVQIYYWHKDIWQPLSEYWYELKDMS